MKNYDAYTINFAPNPPETLLTIGPDGKVIWRGKEVVGDAEFRAAMIDLSNHMCGPRPVQTFAATSKEFEQWYAENAFDYESSPIGSRDCGLQRKAWQEATSRQEEKSKADRQVLVKESIELATKLV